MPKSLFKLDKILDKAWSGKRINYKEGLYLLRYADIFSLGKLAKHLCQRKHPQNLLTFIIDRNITFTNVCSVGCRFCAFYCSPSDKRAFLLSIEEILKKVEELVLLGGTQVMLQGGLHPEIRLDYYVNLCKRIKERFPIHLHSFSPPEIVFLAQKESLSIKEVLQILKDAGLDSLPGGGAEILVDRVRNIVSPHKIKTEQWLEVMRTAHQIGLKTTAIMVYGMVETLEERILHLMEIRKLQAETGGFSAFIPWSFQSTNTCLKGKNSSAKDYLKMVAISRIILDNIVNLQAGWVTEGLELAQLALEFGANDLGGILMEEVVIKSTGLSYQMNIEQAIRLIKKTGKIPAQRNTNYEILKIF